MEGLAALEKKAFLGKAMLGIGKAFNPFAKKIELKKVPRNIGIGMALTLPFGTGSEAIKNTRGLHNVW